MDMMGDSENTDLPVGWVTCRLPDFAEIIMGQSPPSETYNKGKNGLPFFQGKAEFGPIHPTVVKYCNTPNKIAENGATLLSVRAPVGPTNLATEKCCIGRGLAAIHPLDSILPRFVFYLFRCFEPTISKEGTGSTFSAINKQFLEELQISLPPLPEQKRIVAKIEELFSELDKGIESFKTVREQLKFYRQALLKHAFEGKLTAAWREANKDKLETADALLKRIQTERTERYRQQVKEWEQATKEWEKSGKQGSKPGKPSTPKELPPLTAEELAELPELPDGWGWVKLSFITENIQIGPFGTLLHQEDYVAGGKPLVNPSHIKNQKIVPNWDFTISEEKLSELTNYIMQAQDIVIGRRGEMGRCAVVTENESGWLCGTGSLFVRLLPSFNSSLYCSILGSQRVRDSLSSSSIGTTMQNLNQKILHNLPVQVCGTLEQNIMIEHLEAQFSEVDQLDQTITTALQQAETLRQSILKKAFSGQLVPQDPHDEPAAELLARIKAERANHGKAGSTPTKRTPRKKKATP